MALPTYDFCCKIICFFYGQLRLFRVQQLNDLRRLIPRGFRHSTTARFIEYCCPRVCGDKSIPRVFAALF